MYALYRPASLLRYLSFEQVIHSDPIRINNSIRLANANDDKMLVFMHVSFGSFKPAIQFFDVVELSVESSGLDGDKKK